MSTATGFIRQLQDDMKKLQRGAHAQKTVLSLSLVQKSKEVETSRHELAQAAQQLRRREHETLELRLANEALQSTLRIKQLDLDRYTHMDLPPTTDALVA